MYVGWAAVIAQRRLNEANALNGMTDPGGRDWPRCDLCHHHWHGLECGAPTCHCLSSFVEVPC